MEDMTGVCPLVHRLPALQQTGDQFEDDRLEMERSQFIEILNTLWQDRSAIEPIVTYLRRLEKKKVLDGQNDCFKEKLTSFAKIDRAWWASFVVSAAVGGITPNILDLAEVNSPGIVTNLALLLVAISGATGVPPGLRKLSVMTAFATARVDRFGRMAKVKAALRANGDYDINVGGAYTILWSGNNDVTITHIDGAEVTVPTHRPITKDFRLFNWHCDHTCFVEVPDIPSTRCILKTLFPANSGPHLAASNKKSLEATVKALAELDVTPDDDTVKMPDSAEATQMFQGSVQQRREKTAEKARETLQAYRVKRRRQSEVTFAATT